MVVSNPLTGDDATVISHTNGHSTNGHSAKGLRILIVGAGIGGLTASIALREQGHEVVVFEQSKFAHELGAAIHLQPNANGILRRLGIFAETFGANLMERMTEYHADGTMERSMDLTKMNAQWQHPWLLAHRVHLHDALLKAATSEKRKGVPVIIKTGSKVAGVDVSSATITLENGEKIQGDLVVGADGVHSVTRKSVAGREVHPFSSGKSAFRFLIRRERAQENPVLTELLKTAGELVIWFGDDRRAVMYPTTNNELLNFVCIHPESESEAGVGWNESGNLDRLLKVYEKFDPRLKALLELAEPDTLRSWKLLDMEILPTWINEKLALLGDAAHPFLPHQGQGAGVAMEDAAALAVCFPGDTPRDEIVERLKLYEKIRYTRANRIQEYSRLAGEDLKEKTKVFNMFEYTNYNLGHDEWDNSTQLLRKWEWARNPSLYWRMPVGFGPMPGPRQNTKGVVRQASQSTSLTASIKFKTSRTLLQNLFPPNSTSFRFKSPGTIAYASFSQTTLDKMEWLGGSGYKHIGLYIHGVEYVKKDGTVMNGTYMPILFESLTDPIVSGREELGMPKLLTDIDTYRRAESFRINTSWQGAHWGQFALEGLQEAEVQAQGGASVSGEDDDGIFVYRYVPKVGREHKGVAEVEYPVFVPFKEDLPVPKTQRMWKASKASFKLDGLDWDALPTLHHIISRMAELPVYEIVGAKLVEGLGVPDVGQAHRIE